MEDKEIKALLTKGAEKLGIGLTDGQAESFLKYLKELKLWNKKINLTAVDTDREIISRHFLDSLTAYNLVKDRKKILDAGAGAGLPGIPLKIAGPHLDMVLMDSVEKKVHFMRHIIRTVLDNGPGIEAVAARMEGDSTIERYGGGFDCVISRAFTELKRFVELALPYLGQGGIIVAIKGPSVSDELKGLDMAGIAAPEIFEVKVPFEERTNTIVVIRRSA